MQHFWGDTLGHTGKVEALKNQETMSCAERHQTLNTIVPHVLFTLNAMNYGCNIERSELNYSFDALKKAWHQFTFKWFVIVAVISLVLQICSNCEEKNANMMSRIRLTVEKLNASSKFSRNYHFVKLNRNFDGKIIDLRTDTVAKPTKEMLSTMLNAEVGDDFMKECPTVIDLEERCARLFGMEEALFVSTTTMGNLLSIMSHCQGRGQEVIIGKTQHLFKLEQSNLAQFGAIASNAVEDRPDGTIDPTVLRKAIRTPTVFNQETLSKVVCLENSHNQSGGTPLPLDYLKEVGEIAKESDLKVHVDGARLYNAAVSLDVDVKDILTHADSVCMSLAKGLGSPMGAIIGGTKEFIQRALRIRTGLGGSSCMSGFMAAAAVHALGTAKETIEADHRKAKTIARLISEIESDLVSADIAQVKTNIVLMKVREVNAVDLSEMLAEKGLLTSVIDASTIRIVTHLDISDKDLELATCVINETCRKLGNHS